MRPATLRQQAYSRIRDMLVAGDLAAGSQLSEPTLAKELGMSRTPVREAIRQMEMEGLLEYVPRYGATVRLPDARELEEMYSVREALESYAAADAAERISSETLDRLNDLWRQMRKIARQFRTLAQEVMPDEMLRRYLALDMEFHSLIIRAAGNRMIRRILEGTRLLERVFASTCWDYDRKSLVQANRFHGRLLRALRWHDADAARYWTVEAMRVAKENALEHWKGYSMR